MDLGVTEKMRDKYWQNYLGSPSQGEVFRSNLFGLATAICHSYVKNAEGLLTRVLSVETSEYLNQLL
jgi:hypothetical protein